MGLRINQFIKKRMNMKRLLWIAMALMGFTMAQAQTNSLKVVVDNEGNLVGRFVRETDTTFVANPLDWEEVVPKTGYRVEVWTPEKGKGFVIRKDHVRGNLNVRKGPSTRTAVVSTITEADSRKDYPDNTFECVGKTNGWLKEADTKK